MNAKEICLGETDTERKYNAVSWEMVTRPKHLGGLV